MSHAPLFVILAGGEGKRFAPLITNKTIFPFLGKPLLQHQLEQLQRVGVTEVLLATNQDNQEWLDSFSLPGLSIQTKVQPQALGMADALLHLADEIGDQPIVVMNAVDVVDDSLYVTLLDTLASQPYGLITGMRVNSYFAGGYLQLEGDRVTAVIEKPLKGEEPSDLVNLVFHYFSQPQTFLDTLRQQDTNSHSDDVYEQALSQLMKEFEFEVVTYSGYWQKLEYPHFVLDMTELFLHHRLTSHIAETAQISPQAVINGQVYIDDHAIVDAGAVINGPAYIGKHARIGNHSLVRQSIVEDHAVVGFGTEVARSYIGPASMLHHNFIGDSVLEGGVNPSYGTVTTNWRFDKQPIELKTVAGSLETGKDKLGAILAAGVFAGANCTFLPGVSVGAHTRIYPNTVVHQAVAAHVLLKSRQEQEQVGID
jgi:UDP-N-acetylglucosamine diphosphorylase / glucose-1-phosphate thymidylyltransferase / UDP-N-acetylgalactosamine diphosphorylase / glucosamine-1-phosphate N-acetyltransferase / galactosamine-1-phosphate N-acetyltransferase